jgi:hypothetical protein
LPAMLGLVPGSVRAAGDGYDSGQEESLPEYVAKCNAAAHREEKDARLHEVRPRRRHHVTRV